jgi:hypothetical protein
VKLVSLLCFVVACFGQVLASPSEPLPPLDESRWSSAQKNVTTYSHEVPTKLGVLKVEIHLPEDSADQASFVAQILSLDAPKLVAYFDWLPEGAVHFHLDSQQKTANGFARVFPHNHIGLHLMPPLGDEALSVHSQYMRALIVHELIHILHLDQTRGILAGIRAVFGSVGKLGGVVPRWFSEGVATWGETKFTSGGRLHHRLLDQELLRALSKPDFCQTIDCLDNPGRYPYGHLSYWLGARFLNSLEEKQAGSIACLVTANSRRLPFFLDGAFKRCTGSPVSELFQNFRNQYLEEDQKKRDMSALRTMSVPSETPLYQYGLALTQGYLLRAIRQRHRVDLEVTTLASSEQEKLKGVEGRLLSIATPSSFGKKMDRVLIRQSMSQSDGKQFWTSIHLPSKTLTEIKLPHEADYLFEWNEGRYLLWRFHLGRFELASFVKGEAQSVAMLRLDNRETMGSPRLVKWNGEDQMIFSSQWQNEDGQEVYSLKSISPGKKPRLLYLSHDEFKVLDIADDVILLSSRGEFISLGDKSRVLSSAWSDQLVMLRLHGGDSSLAFASFAFGSEKDLLLQLNTGTMGALKPVPANEKNLSMLKGPDNMVAKSYPGLRHFRPYYWALGLGGSEQLTRYDITSSVADPLSRHQLDITASYYQEISEPGGVASYTYAPSSLGMNITAAKSFTVRGARTRADEQMSQSVMMFYQKTQGRFTLIPSLYAHFDDVNDFISSRNQKIYGFNQGLIYTPLFPHSFIGPASLQLSVFHQTTQGFEAFLGERAKLNLNFRSGWEPLDFHFKGSYGRLRKTGLVNGLLFGGGSEALYNLGGYHEFYGLEYGDFFGNQITTLRGQLNLRLMESYRGLGLFPLFLKSTHALLGIDYAKSQVIFLGRDRVAAPDIKSYFAGLRFKTDFSYFIPVDADFIYSQVQNPSGDNQSQLLFLLRGSFNFRSF